MHTSEHDMEPKWAHTQTYHSYSSSCNLERLASQWYAVSRGIRSVRRSTRENNDILHQLYNETLHQNLETCFRCSLLSSRIPRSSTSAFTFLSLIKSSPTVNFLALPYEQCHAIVRLKIDRSRCCYQQYLTNISLCLLQTGLSLQTARLRIVHHQLQVS
jgi:hypothetical protein